MIINDLEEHGKAYHQGKQFQANFYGTWQDVITDGWRTSALLTAATEGRLRTKEDE